MRHDDTSTETDVVVLRLGVTGDLGHMDFLTVLRALQGSYELLQRTAHRAWETEQTSCGGSSPASGRAVP